MNNDGENNLRNGETSVMKCDDIQSVLLAYMSRELGDAHTHLIREHLRKCPDCRAVAMEMQATIDVLRKGSEAPENMPSRLSGKRRRRLKRALLHPLWEWVGIHHFIVAVMIMWLVVTALLLILRVVEPWHEGKPEQGIPVTISSEPPDENLQD